MKHVPCFVGSNLWNSMNSNDFSQALLPPYTFWLPSEDFMESERIPPNSSPFRPVDIMATDSCHWRHTPGGRCWANSGPTFTAKGIARAAGMDRN